MAIPNILAGLSGWLFALAMNMYAFVQGVSYIALGVMLVSDPGFIAKKLKLSRLLFSCVLLPLTIFNIKVLQDMAIRFGTEGAYGIDVAGYIVFAAVPMIACCVDIYLFFRPGLFKRVLNNE